MKERNQKQARTRDARPASERREQKAEPGAEKGYFNVSMLLAVAVILASGAYFWHDKEARARQKREAGEQFEGFRLLETFERAGDCYTQGLDFFAGRLFESCGLYGESRVRRARLADGRVSVEKETRNSADLFGEGAQVVEMQGGAKQLMQLSWREGVVTFFDLSLEHIESARLEIPEIREGWGLAQDPAQPGVVFISDGSSAIKQVAVARTPDKPAQLRLLRTIRVSLHGKPVPYLNELAFFNGALFANRYMTNQILEIDPDTGAVLRVLDLSPLEARARKASKERQAYRFEEGDCLNGIAFDQEGLMLVTGKRWPLLFKLAV